MAGSDALVRLPDGTTLYGPVDPRTWTADDRLRAKLLTRDVGAGIAWHRNRPFAQMLQTTSQAIAVSSWTEIDLNWEMIDGWGGHSGADSAWFAPITINGNSDPSDYYLCTGYVPLSASDPAKVCIAGLVKNDVEIREGTKIPTPSGHVVTPMVIDLVGITGGDWLSLAAWTNVAAGANTSVSGKCPSLTVRWVGSAVGTASPLPAAPHTWSANDQVTASATGASPAGGVKVPLNSEVRDVARYLNYPPLARLTSTGVSQSVPTGGTWYSIKFPSKDIDTYGGWSSGANTRYTIQRAGLYLIAGYASVSEVSAAGGYRAARLLVNGTTPYGGQSAIPMTSGTTGTALYAVRHLRLNAGDYVEVQMSSTGSSALPVNSSSGGASRLIAVWRGL